MSATFRDPASGTTAVDLTHLSRMTLGNPAVEREVLSLFQDQITTALAKFGQADWTELRPLAHALKGAARGVGALRVGQAAATLEVALKDPADAAALAIAMARLTAAATEAHAAITELLRVR